MRTRTVLFIVALFFSYVQSSAQKGSVRKSTSHYYINDARIVPDSMFITLSHYNPAGDLFKVEETHYVKGEKSHYDLTLYLDQDHLLAMYNDGKLVMKSEYDSMRTLIKQLAIINHGKDTVINTYFPKYRDGKLVERKMVTKVALGSFEQTEYYTYQDFPDSSIVTAITETDYSVSTEKKCYTKNKKPLYTENTLRSKGTSSFQSHKFENKYDAAGNKIEILEYENGKVIFREQLRYTKNKLVSSVRYMDGRIIKTTHE